ncbi:asparagine synthase [Candidatus Woesearchaeota archaeon]|nr:asparagine synthase [Candidatus Woesearchaeota archaeon]
MIKTFTVTDLRKEDVFPNLDYRFSTFRETDTGVVLERDFLGENPLHYYSDIRTGELIVANNIVDIKDYLEKQQRTFTWERVRAVSNNSRTTIDDFAFISASPKEEEREPTLQGYKPKETTDYADIANVGKTVRRLLQESLEARLSSIADSEVGLLLSGGLDSMSVGYLLSKAKDRKVTAFTLKVNEDDQDVVKSRELAKRFNIDLSEVKIDQNDSGSSITLQRYSPTKDLRYTKKIAEDINLDNAILESLKISGNPKKDNLFCAAAMYLIGQAITVEGIRTVFCGEGPNEMINDYGYNPRDSGYATEDKGDVQFREALTFGLKKTDRQLGRGGLPKHAIARMGKIFAHYGLRLEAPYFNRDVARVMTRVPHSTSYNTIKQHLVGAMFKREGLDVFIEGTSKEKFQDGSGVSRLFRDYDQKRLIDMFEGIYGIQKTGYLK